MKSVIDNLGEHAVRYGIAFGFAILLLLASFTDATAKILAGAGRVWNFQHALRARARIGSEVGRRVDKRREFATEASRKLVALDVRERWADERFAELEANVETVGSRPRKGPFQFFRTARGLRLERSLTRALRKTKEPVVLLQGDPGSGKSVALRHLARHMADKAAASRRLDSRVALYVNLKELRRDAVGGVIPPINAKLIERFVDEQLRAGSTITVDRFVDDEFQPSVEAGTFMFLFDSFDEIPEVLGSTEIDDVVLAYSDAISSFLRGMRRCRGVVASRDFRAPEGLAWPVWRLVPLSIRRQRRLIRKALLNRRLEDAVASGLFEADDEVAALAANPMFLSLLCGYVEKHDGEFPSGTHVVIEDFIGARIASDVARLDTRFSLEPADVRRCAKVAAYCMASQPGLGLAPRRTALEDAIEQTGLCSPELARIGLDALEWVKLGRSSEDAGEPIFTFAHRRFQEYFATCAILDGDTVVGDEKLLFDQRWRETAVTLLQLQHTESVAIVGRAEAALDATAHGPSVLEVLHVLRLLQAGFSGSPARLPASLRTAAGRHLARLVTASGTYEESQCLEVASVAPSEQFLELVTASLRSNSPLLRDTAFRSLARLGTLTPDLVATVRSLVLGRAVAAFPGTSGDTALRAQVARIPSTDVRQFARAARVVMVVDLATWIAVAAAAVSIGPIALAALIVVPAMFRYGVAPSSPETMAFMCLTLRVLLPVAIFLIGALDSPLLLVSAYLSTLAPMMLFLATAPHRFRWSLLLAGPVVFAWELARSGGQAFLRAERKRRIRSAAAVVGPIAAGWIISQLNALPIIGVLGIALILFALASPLRRTPDLIRDIRAYRHRQTLALPRLSGAEFAERLVSHHTSWGARRFVSDVLAGELLAPDAETLEISAQLAQLTSDQRRSRWAPMAVPEALAAIIGEAGVQRLGHWGAEIDDEMAALRRLLSERAILPRGVADLAATAVCRADGDPPLL